jgi:hypothetical protein
VACPARGLEAWRRVERGHGSRRRERKEEGRRRQEEARKREDQRRRIEERNREHLEEGARAWAEARRLRRFIQACERSLQADDGSLAAGGWQQGWLAWAWEHADRLDPMTNGFLEADHERLTDTDDRDDQPEPAEPSVGQIIQDVMFGKGCPS